MGGKFKELAKDIGIFAIGGLGSKLILFLLVPVYTNYLTPDEYGIGDLVVSLGQLIIPFVSVVIFDAVTRFGLVSTIKQENVLFNALSIWGAGSILLVVLLPLFNLYTVVAPWKWYLYGFVVFNAGISIELNYFKIQGKNKLFAGLSIAQVLILACCNVLLLVIFDCGIKGYLLSLVISNIVVFIGAFVIGGITKDLLTAEFDKILLKDMLAFSFPLILNNVSWWVIHSSDRIMIEAMVGASALGIYTVAAKLPSIVNVFISIFSQAWGISSIKEYETSNNSAFFSQVFNLYSSGVLMIGVIIISLIKPFMKIYVGVDFYDSWQLVPLLIISAIFSAISAFYGSLYSAMKRTRNNMYSTLLAACVNLILNFLLINFFDVWGAVIATVAAYLVLCLYRIFDVSRYIRIEMELFNMAINFLLIIVQTILVLRGTNVFIYTMLIWAAMLINNIHLFVKFKRIKD